MSFSITDTVGFVDKDGKIDLPIITVIAKDSLLGFYVKAGNVNWKRNSEFSTAEIEIVENRIDKDTYLGSEFLAVGTEIAISASLSDGTKSILFSGYIMAQSLRASGGSDDSKDETIILKCVDYKYDLYREIIIGQVGIQADDDGTEAVSGGIYGAGSGWFTGLPCVFNDRTFSKLAESSWSHFGIISPHGNGRKSPAVGAGDSFGILPEIIFDGDYFALNIKSFGGAPPADRNIAWSAWDMIKYVMFYCYSPPYSFEDAVADAGPFGGGAPVEDIFVETKRIILGPPTGMDDLYPETIDIQGLRATDAITKICQSVGYNWWLEPTESASILNVWRTGLATKAIKIFMGSGGSGMPVGLYNIASTGPLAYPLVNKEKWNIDDIDINVDYTQVIGALIGTTQNIRVQNAFYLRKGWTSEVWFEIIKKVSVADATTGNDQIKLEGMSGTFIDGESTGKSTRYEWQRLQNNMIKIRINNLAEDEAIKLKGQDSFFSTMRRWITDETGLITTTKDEKRDPFNFIPTLFKVNGSTYMIKPRPFLSRNIATAKSGDPSPPKTYFPKFSPGQTKEAQLAVDFVSENIDLRETIDKDKSTIKKDGKDFYPFGSKKGSVRILEDRSGIFLESGDLNMVNVTIDPKTNKISFLAPMVIGAVEHDQAGLVIKRGLFSIGKIGTMMSGRRWVDGKKYRIDIVNAIDTTTSVSPEQAKAGATAIASPSLASYSIAEKIKMGLDIDSDIPYFTVPIISMRARIPTISIAYKPGNSIFGIVDRLDFTPEPFSACIIVAIQFDLKSMNTIISVESEVMNPNLGVGVE